MRLPRPRFWLLPMLAGLAAGTAAAETGPVRLGILPHVSARVLLVNYQPLRAHLAAALKREVEIVSAPNFKAYHARSMAGDYDVFVTAANLGRIADLDGGHRPVAAFEPPIPAILVALKDEPPGELGMLRGKALALANPQSLVALAGMHWLKRQGLAAGADFKTLHTPNDDSLGHVLAAGDAPFAMMSMGEFRAIGPALREKLRIDRQFATVPGFMVLLRGTLPADQAAALAAAVLAFSASDQAEPFKALTGTMAVRAIRDADRAVLDDFVDETRALLR